MATVKATQGHQKKGAGNHRGSIFRLLVGDAIIQKEGVDCPTWGNRSGPTDEHVANELLLEQKVTTFIGAMHVVCMPIMDEPSPTSNRKYIERNSIALLSNFTKDPVDQTSRGWLGLASSRQLVKQSGLWNQQHTTDTYDPEFLKLMSRLIRKQCYSYDE